MMFILRLAVVACLLSVAVIGISVFILNTTVGRRPSADDAARVEPVSRDMFEVLDPLEMPEILDELDEQGRLARSPDVPLTDATARAASKDLQPGASRIPKPGRSAPGTVVMIDKKNYKLSVLRNGATLKEYDVAVGKNTGDKKRRGDMRTPEGEFKVQQFHDASSWGHDFGDGKGKIKGAYGPLFIRLRTPPWSGIGIHGTHDPLSIGNNVTEGCVRMKNEE
ncbi:MAG: L,D-transpeptidase, partial [Synergistaceae bacterium]|nr:L,D-transpeptidase [Synergistaceae bacterium]